MIFACRGANISKEEFITWARLSPKYNSKCPDTARYDTFQQQKSNETAHVYGLPLLRRFANESDVLDDRTSAKSIKL